MHALAAGGYTASAIRLRAGLQADFPIIAFSRHDEAGCGQDENAL